MTIIVQRLGGDSLQVVTGHTRLRVGLKAVGKVPVVDAETNETPWVHMVDGQTVVLADHASAAAERKGSWRAAYARPGQGHLLGRD